MKSEKCIRGPRNVTGKENWKEKRAKKEQRRWRNLRKRTSGRKNRVNMCIEDKDKGKENKWRSMPLLFTKNGVENLTGETWNSPAPAPHFSVLPSIGDFQASHLIRNHHQIRKRRGLACSWERFPYFQNKNYNRQCSKVPAIYAIPESIFPPEHKSQRSAPSTKCPNRKYRGLIPRAQRPKNNGLQVSKRPCWALWWMTTSKELT